MKKEVWIFNHYATNMYFDRAGRHYWIAKSLQKQGYKPTIFCASTNHFSNDHVHPKGLYTLKTIDDIDFVFVNTVRYEKSRVKRVINMVQFYFNLLAVSKKIKKEKAKPDVIIASSVHPLTLIAGQKIAKRENINNISEVRDLWPESLVAYGIIKRNGLIAKILYAGERYIYKKAQALVITWQGGRQYIIDKKWEDVVNLNKVYYISNGIVINDFDQNIIDYKVNDEDLLNSSYKNIVYAGSIRKVNNLNILLSAAKIINNEDKSIRFLIYGSGSEEEALIKRCKDENICNVIFKGKVLKHEIPSILSQAYANILHNTSTSLNKYGQSQNKLFEYLAAGKCIIQTYSSGYSILDKYNCGLSAKIQTPEEIAKITLEICNNPKLATLMGENARRAASDYDYEILTSKYIDIIENM